MTREEISNAIEEYLEEHTISELLDVVACRAEDKERKEDEKIHEAIKISEQKSKETVDNSGWDFQWDGRGSYEQARAGFYGEFS